MAAVEARFKQRSADTHRERHAPALRAAAAEAAARPVCLLGSSMFERLLTLHERTVWRECGFERVHAINLGVGGDGVQHALYRVHAA
eukprot:CAMPEP_0198353514 /NCGR_PEP_ID=MMETSP1450-20131203/111633_1 /TAXON_ID=753684 ORGANISM="Madagascaria erythrocladiodes, Strain CCMP3234" /NCGR_SAMPLE_ID=MMETSP1450 /ASSEMBLY_ACC=CAM_ASM_001115 /LENGTH=86 /DNA_ID=CAMNT_0044059661 /DNA_START=98 /DNA_END=354 /DNA_ORIENTATION=+